MTDGLSYLDRLTAVVKGVEVTNRNGREPEGVEVACRLFKDAQANGRKVMLIGNGGSAAIASHTAIDLSKNACIPAMAFNDAAALTCLSNDFGYYEVFAKQISYHALPGDVLVAISSSGMSPNILNAVNEVRFVDPVMVVTFSGFDPANRLRKFGDLNFYVPSDQYGFVELSHMILLHSIIDKLVAEHQMLEAAE
jgi:D-sedoheptulose 7-phosphate isomerase